MVRFAATVSYRSVPAVGKVRKVGRRGGGEPPIVRRRQAEDEPSENEPRTSRDAPRDRRVEASSVIVKDRKVMGDKDNVKDRKVVGDKDESAGTRGQGEHASMWEKLVEEAKTTKRQ